MGGGGGCDIFIACKEIDHVSEFFCLTVNFWCHGNFQYLIFQVEKEPCFLDDSF